MLCEHGRDYPRKEPGPQPTRASPGALLSLVCGSFSPAPASLLGQKVLEPLLFPPASLRGCHPLPISGSLTPSAPLELTFVRGLGAFRELQPPPPPTPAMVLCIETVPHHHHPGVETRFARRRWLVFPCFE